MATKLHSAQRAFRRMNLKLAEGLQEKDCKTIVYLDNLTPLNNSDLNFKVLSSLETHGYTSPGKVDHLESLLSDIHRLDLLPIITRYKESKEYKDAVEERRLKGRARMQKEKAVAEGDLEADGNKKIMKSLCSVLISHTTELTKNLEILCEILEEEDEEELAKGLKMFAENTHMTSTAMGINSQKTSRTHGGKKEKPIATATKRCATMPLVVESRKQHSSDACTTSKHKKPLPLPRSKLTKPPTPLARDYRSLERSGWLARQEEAGLATATMPTLPHEERSYEPRTESEECHSGSEISYDTESTDSDSTGCRPDSPAESEYMPLLPRTDSNVYTLLSHPACSASSATDLSPHLSDSD